MNVLVQGHVYRIGKPDELQTDHSRACPLNGVFQGLPPIFLSWDADERCAVGNDLLLAKIRAAGGVVGTSVTRFGLHTLPTFACLEAYEEVGVALGWLRQFFGTGGANKG